MPRKAPRNRKDSLLFACGRLPRKTPPKTGPRTKVLDGRLPPGHERHDGLHEHGQPSMAPPRRRWGASPSSQRFGSSVMQLCLSCGERPANPESKETLPLCDECASLATNRRGVTYGATVLRGLPKKVDYEVGHNLPCRSTSKATHTHGSSLVPWGRAVSWASELVRLLRRCIGRL